MKIFSKLASVFTAAVISVAAVAVMVVSAGADSIYDTANAISSEKSVSAIVPANKKADYKVTVSESGTLKLSIEWAIYAGFIMVFDSDGNKIPTMDSYSTSGSCSSINEKTHEIWWNNTIEKYKGTVSYSVKPGIYYIRFDGYSTTGNGKLTFTATYPSTSNTAKINYITINMARGDSLSLGADLTGSGTVTWKSSKPSVAAVSSTGKVTAKSKGSAIISAKVGKTTKKIKIKVS